MFHFIQILHIYYQPKKHYKAIITHTHSYNVLVTSEQSNLVH